MFPCKKEHSLRKEHVPIQKKNFVNLKNMFPYKKEPCSLKEHVPIQKKNHRQKKTWSNGGLKKPSHYGNDPK